MVATACVIVYICLFTNQSRDSVLFTFVFTTNHVTVTSHDCHVTSKSCPISGTYTISGTAGVFFITAISVNGISKIIFCYTIAPLFP